MEELIGQVAQKTGLPFDRARTAVETVLAFLKGKLPSALGGQIDQAVSGGRLRRARRRSQGPRGDVREAVVSA